MKTLSIEQYTDVHQLTRNDRPRVKAKRKRLSLALFKNDYTISSAL